MKDNTYIDLINYRRKRAFDTLDEVEKLLSQGMLFLSMNRIYYAGFYIVSALLLLDDFSTSKHKQLIGYFNKKYLRNGVIDIEIGSILNLSYRKRTSVDYQDFVTITKEEIKQHFESMKIFVTTVDDVINGRIKIK